MTKREKTRAETHNWKPSKKDGLMEYLKYAVHLTCRRLGWDWSVQRETETFCKIHASLQSASMDTNILEIYFDIETDNRLFRYSLVSMFGYDKQPISRHTEAEAFVDALVQSVGNQLKDWLQIHPEDTNKVNRLVGRAPGEKPKPEQPTEVIRQTQNLKENLNRELERESRRKLVARANEMRLADPKRPWADIAKELDLPERTLRDWRHNPHYQAAENGK